MNTISVVVLNIDDHCRQLSIAVDGIPLYRIFEDCIDDDIGDSVLLPFSNTHDLKDLALLWDCDFFYKGSEDFIRYLTDSPEEEVLPILSCPEDYEDLDCLLLCAYVRKDEDYVYWDRIGRIIHAQNEWDKKAEYGVRCKDVLSEEECKIYGPDTFMSQIDDNWFSEHWREELFHRNMGFLREHYKSPGGVKWLKEVNWKFPADNYWKVVDFFRKEFDFEKYIWQIQFHPRSAFPNLIVSKVSETVTIDYLNRQVIFKKTFTDTQMTQKEAVNIDGESFRELLQFSEIAKLREFEETPEKELHCYSYRDNWILEYYYFTVEEPHRTDGCLSGIYENSPFEEIVNWIIRHYPEHGDLNRMIMI